MYISPLNLLLNLTILENFPFTRENFLTVDVTQLFFTTTLAYGTLNIFGYIFKKCLRCCFPLKIIDVIISFQQENCFIL